MASLKQAYQQDTDAEEIEMISDDTLFTVYNPKFIEDKKQMIEDYIETLYERNTPNMVWDPVTQMVYYQSQNLESLVMYIIEEKKKLNAFIRKSNRNLYHLYAVLEGYTKQEQIFIKNFTSEIQRCVIMSLWDALKLIYITMSKLKERKDKKNITKSHLMRT